MSDPYLDFNDKNDLSAVQVNVFHVKDTLRGLSLSDRNSVLHDECYVFNPIDPKNPMIPNNRIVNGSKLISIVLPNFLIPPPLIFLVPQPPVLFPIFFFML